MAEVDYVLFVDRMIDDYEGPYGWDAGDPGGPTKYGITCYDLAAWMGKKMNSMAAWAPIVRAMSLSTAEAIYRSKYATVARFNDLAPGCDTEVFDMTVNSGMRALWFAQAIVGEPRANVLTDRAVTLINADPVLFIGHMSERRLAFLRGLGTWSRFGVGWTRRVNDLKSYSLNLATHVNPNPLPEPIVDTVVKIKQAQAAYNKLFGLNLDVDGDEGPATKVATRRFQQQYNIVPVDGLLGPITFAKIDQVMPPDKASSLLSTTDWHVMGKGISDADDINRIYGVAA